MKSGQISLVSCPASETQYPASLCTQTRVLVSAGFGRRKAVWVLGSLQHTRRHIENQAYVDVSVNRIELIALALSLLGLARRATAAQATACLRAQAHRISILIRPALRLLKH